MSEHPSIERMNDLVDGSLPSTIVADVRAHLESCSVCREEYAVLSETVSSLRGLPRGGRPPEGSWAGIEGRLGSQEVPEPEAATVVRFPGPLARSRRRRWTLSLPQMAAAAAAVAIVSAGGMWLAIQPGMVVAPTPQRGANESTFVLGAAARAAGTSMAGYDQAVLELEALVAQGREVMRPETVRALEESLSAIDDAVADVRKALAADPSSELLMSMMVSHQTARMRVLRRAATMIESRS